MLPQMEGVMPWKTRKVVIVKLIFETETWRDSAMAGSAGVYMSELNGPTRLAKQTIPRIAIRWWGEKAEYILYSSAFGERVGEAMALE